MIEAEYKSKKPVNALICFSKQKTGDALGLLVTELLKARADNSEIAVLHLIGPAQMDGIDNIEAYKNELFGGIFKRCEEYNILVRSFVKQSESFVNDILETAREQSSNLVLLGMGGYVFNSALWKQYEMLKNTPGSSEEDIDRQFEMPVARSLRNVSSLLNRNKVDTGIFVENNLTKVDKIFVPILDKNDVYVFRYLQRFLQREGTSAMIWDAIGVLNTDTEIQKAFHYIQKRADGRLLLWDNDRKIDVDFIEQQDLVLTGIDGWNKLVFTALPWFSVLPSILIIKKEQVTD